MGDIKYTYFDLRVKGEPARLLLAYGGARYTDERVSSQPTLIELVGIETLSLKSSPPVHMFNILLRQT